MNPRLFRIKSAIIIALSVSALLILQQYTDYLINDYDYNFSWFAVSSKILINYLFWAPLITLLHKLGCRLLSKKMNVQRAAIHFLISIGVALVHRVAVIRIYDFVYFIKSGFLRDFLTPGNQVQLSAGVISSFMQYWVIMIIIVAVLYYTKYIEKQKELNAAQLNALKMQLQPHFLFNTLNSITALIDIDSKKAQKMLSQLGFLMREILEHDSKHYISLRNEIKYVQTYLDIEYIRFQDRLNITYEINEELLSARVPSLILQPIVENAVKHGISKCPEGGEIVLSAKSDNGRLELSVVNDYRKLNGKEHGYGIGTLNVQKRLEQMYANEFTYKHGDVNGKYFSKITIPLEFN